MALKLALCPLLLAVAACQPLLAQEAPKAPFTLQITGNLVPGYSDEWDFASTIPTTRKAGEMVVIAIQKTNISNHAIQKISHAGDFYGYHFDVLDGSGTPVERKSRHSNFFGGSAAAEGASHTLQPGQSALEIAEPTNWLNLSQPGTYTIQAWARAWDDPHAPIVKSNTLTLIIEPASAPPSQ